MFSTSPQSASKWITILAAQLISMIIGFLILKSEIRKRKQLEIKFTTIWFKFSQSHVLPLISLLKCFSLDYVPSFCIFSNYFSIVFTIFSYASMGFYQLYRLHYCFANGYVHSNKGYPKWIFIVMGSSAMICVVYLCISSLFVDANITTILISQCAYNDKYEFYFHPIQLFGPHLIMPWDCYSISILTYTVWDLFTLFLYVMKIWTFRKYATEEPTVYKRIMSILHKIFILTIFYQIFFLFYGVLFTLKIHDSQWVLWLIVSEMTYLSVCGSIYLMMDHNEEQYIKFLRIIYFFGCIGYVVVGDIL